MCRRTPHGFTLVELLVVVGIIVLLLSMLTPAVNRALYRARLASCAAQQRGTATGIHAYAFDFKRHYPDRQAPSTDGKYFPLAMLAGASTPESTHHPFDIRPTIRPYIQISKQLRDPFVGDVELDFDDPLNASTVVSAYAMWFGWFYIQPGKPLVGMEKVGDTWEWSERDPNAPTHTYGLLLGDLDLNWDGQRSISAAHPDVGGAGGGSPKLYLAVQNDLAAPTYGIRTFQSFWGWSFMQTGVAAKRQLMDTNFTYNDESVHQLNGYKHFDERYHTVPYFYNDKLRDYDVNIPTR